MHKFILIILFTVFNLPLAFSQDVAEILRKMEETMRGESTYGEMTMKIIRPRYEREISLRSWHIGTDYSMIYITAPSRDRGTAFLMRQKDIWSYDPRIDRTTRMPSSMMAQSWMGSDFTNDDLVRDSDVIDDYEHKILRTEMYDGRECYVLELIPKPGTPIVWGKVVMWIATDSYLQLRIEQYDQRDRLVNTMKLEDIKVFDGREVPSRITVTPANKENHQTILIQHKLEFNIDISESFFSQENMLRLD